MSDDDKYYGKKRKWSKKKKKGLGGYSSFSFFIGMVWEILFGRQPLSGDLK